MKRDADRFSERRETSVIEPSMTSARAGIRERAESRQHIDERGRGRPPSPGCAGSARREDSASLFRRQHAREGQRRFTSPMNSTPRNPARPLSSWLDSCARPTPSGVQRFGWEVRPVPEVPDIALLDRLLGAPYQPTLHAWACNGPYLEFSGPIPSTTDDIGAFMVDHAYGAVAIEATPEHYLYKEPRNRYAFAIGEREFVEALVPGSMDECRVRLMEWIESVKLTRGERKVIEDEVFAYVAQP